MLTIDSLTLKLEGLLRDLCEFNKINTFQFSKDKLVHLGLNKPNFKR